MSNKIVIMSDIHHCHSGWYGVSSDERMNQMVEALNTAYRKDPYDAIFFLGDYSLDHWVYQIGGSWLHQQVSYTQKLVDEYLSRLECPVRYMIPGNHEQYGHEHWKRITGCERQFAVVHEGYLLLMLDTFGENLDPTEDSDGTYKPADVEYIQAQMTLHPDLPVLLCAHFFDLRKETEAFTKLVINEERILCLFCGHDHQNRVEASAVLGGKLIIHDGQFSYAGFHDPVRCPWGWIEALLYEEGIICTYVHPSATLETNDGSRIIHAGEGPMIQITREAAHPLPRRR